MSFPRRPTDKPGLVSVWAVRLDELEAERDRYRQALERLMEFGKRLMASDDEAERGIGCCICEGARMVGYLDEEEDR